MASLNRVMLIGKDPEVRYTGGGTAVASFSIAITEKFKKGEEWEEKTEWHPQAGHRSKPERKSYIARKG